MSDESNNYVDIKIEFGENSLDIIISILTSLNVALLAPLLRDGIYSIQYRDTLNGVINLLNAKIYDYAVLSIAKHNNGEFFRIGMEVE